MISSNPIIFPTLVPDLPSVEGSGLTFTAQLLWDALSTDEICKIFIALGAEYRPTLPYIVKLSEPKQFQYFKTLVGCRLSRCAGGGTRGTRAGSSEKDRQMEPPSSIG